MIGIFNYKGKIYSYITKPSINHVLSAINFPLIERFYSVVRKFRGIGNKERDEEKHRARLENKDDHASFEKAEKKAGEKE